MKDFPMLGRVLLVVAVGFLAAMPFYREKVNRSADPSGGNLTLRRQVGLKIDASGGSPYATSGYDRKTSAGDLRHHQPAVIHAAPDKVSEPKGGLGPVPRLATRYRPFDSPDFDSPTSHFDSLDPRETPDAHAYQPTSPSSPASASAHQQRFILHAIVDGDTLSELAKRYLGDSRRYLELYELNRHVLVRPDVLPIGRQLRIPAVFGRPPAGADQEAQDSTRATDIYRLPSP